MAFKPNSDIYLLKGVNLDNKYKHTFKFTNATNQRSYFDGKRYKDYPNYQYIRADSIIKIQEQYDDIINCNYLMYQNNSGKWIYCFINKKDYINENTTALHIETDVMQTFQFDYTVNPSFVAREHILYDNVGNNTIPEDFDLGTPVWGTITNVPEMSSMNVVVGTTVNLAGEPITGSIVTGTYSGLGFYSTPDTNYQWVDSFVTSLSSLGKASGIIVMFTMPSCFVDTSLTQPINQPTAKVVTKTISKTVTNVGGYVPRHKKLFTYPYSYFSVSNNMGQVTDYHYEWFNSTECVFDLTCEVAPNPTVYLTPRNYRGGVANYDEGMTLSGYPLCAWTTNIYQNWKAQNSFQTAISVGESAIGIGTSVATGNPFGAVSGSMQIASLIGAYHSKSLEPNSVHGQHGGGGNLARGTLNFHFIKKTIDSERVRLIDDYFHMYGYRTNRIKVPNITGRPNFNYVQTVDCTIDTNINIEYKNKIQDIFDGGVTFWHNQNIDYSVSNPGVYS